MKLIILSVMVACAMSMKMPDMSMLGGLMEQAQSFLGDMDPSSLESMVKNIDPSTLQDAMNNLPPQMLEMINGLGLSKEDISKAVKELPGNMGDIKNLMSGSGGMHSNLLKKVKQFLPEDIAKNMEESLENPEKAEEMMNIFKKYAGKALGDFGLSTEDLDDMDNLMPKMMKKLVEFLKTKGIEIDMENPQTIQEQMKKMMYSQFGISEDEDPEKVKEIIGKYMKEHLSPMGIEINTDDPMETVNKMKEFAIHQVKNFGIDIKEGATGEEIKELVMTRLKDMGIDIGNPSSLIQFAMQNMDMIKGLFGSFFGGEEQQEEMPMPMPMPMGPMEVPIPQMVPQMNGLPITLNLDINLNGANGLIQPPATFPSYLHGAEDALARAYGSDQEIVANVMNIQGGLRQGVVTERAVEELLQDLLHYRVQARVLMARNQMLERELMSQRPAPIPMTKSPFINRILHKCRHHRF